MNIGRLSGQTISALMRISGSRTKNCPRGTGKANGCGTRPGAVSLKFIEEQPQILRLTTPELRDVRGPVRSE